MTTISTPVSRLRAVMLAGPLGDPLRRLKRRIESPVAKRSREEDTRLALLLVALLGPDGSLIDVGANRGDIVRHAVRISPAGNHIAIEPLPDLANAIQAELPAVSVLECATAAEPGTATFYRDPRASTRSSLAAPDGPRGSQAIEVRIDTVDRIVTRLGIVPSVIKIDVEGAELGTLRGMAETMSSARPHIVFECDRAWLQRFGHVPGQVHDLLVRSHGYEVFDMDGVGPIDRERFEEIAGTTHRDARWNFVARAGPA